MLLCLKPCRLSLRFASVPHHDAWTVCPQSELTAAKSTEVQLQSALTAAKTSAADLKQQLDAARASAEGAKQQTAQLKAANTHLHVSWLT